MLQPDQDGWLLSKYIIRLRREWKVCCYFLEQLPSASATNTASTSSYIGQQASLHYQSCKHCCFFPFFPVRHASCLKLDGKMLCIVAASDIACAISPPAQPLERSLSVVSGTWTIENRLYTLSYQRCCISCHDLPRDAQCLHTGN